MASIDLEQKSRQLGVIVAPDRIVIPEHMSIARTARVGQPEALSAACTITVAEHLAAAGIFHINNPPKIELTPAGNLLYRMKLLMRVLSVFIRSVDISSSSV